MTTQSSLMEIRLSANKQEIELLKMTPKQEQVWDKIVDAKRGTRTILGYGGSMGGGKTAAICLIAWNYLLQYPGCNIVIARSALTHLRTPGGTIDQFYQKFAPAEGKYIKDGGVIAFKNDTNINRCSVRLEDWPPDVYSTVYFRGISDESFFASAELTAIFIDEADRVPVHSVIYSLTRLRQRLPDGRFPKFLFLAASNPAMGWFKDWFIDSLESRKEALAEIKGIGAIDFIESYQKDNPFLDNSYGDFMNAVLDEEMREQMVEGSFESFAGKLFMNFSELHHGIYQKDTLLSNGMTSIGLESWAPSTTRRISLRGETLLIPKFRYAIGGLDFAGTQKNAHLSTGTVSVVLESGRDILMDCFAGNGPKIFDRQQEWMTSVETALGQRVEWTADKTQPTGIQAMQSLGYKVVTNLGKNDSWVNSIKFIRDRFKLDNDGIPQSMYLIRKATSQWVTQMGNYRVNPDPNPDGELREKPIEVDDDLVDAYRYQQERLYKRRRREERKRSLPYVYNEGVTDNSHAQWDSWSKGQW